MASIHSNGSVGSSGHEGLLVASSASQTTNSNSKGVLENIQDGLQGITQGIYSMILGKRSSFSLSQAVMKKGSIIPLSYKQKETESLDKLQDVLTELRIPNDLQTLIGEYKLPIEEYVQDLVRFPITKEFEECQAFEVIRKFEIEDKKRFAKHIAKNTAASENKDVNKLQTEYQFLRKNDTELYRWKQFSVYYKANYPCKHSGTGAILQVFQTVSQWFPWNQQKETECPCQQTVLVAAKFDRLIVQSQELLTRIVSSVLTAFSERSADGFFSTHEFTKWSSDVKIHERNFSDAIRDLQKMDSYSVVSQSFFKERTTWIHLPSHESRIEDAGFRFAPTEGVFYAPAGLGDRCRCDTCKVTIERIRPWDQILNASKSLQQCQQELHGPNHFRREH